MKKSRSIPLLVGLAVVLGANYLAYQRWYAAPLAEKRSELQQVEERIRSIRNRTTTMIEERHDIKPLITRTLGPSAQAAEAALRSRLNTLSRQAGLPGTSVESRVAQRATVNPASDARLSAYRRADARGRLRSTPEAAFVTMSATLRGEGPTENVLDALALLESQEWLHRVTAVSIEPTARSEGRVANYSFEIQTLFVPDASPEDGPALVDVAPSRRTLVEAIAGRSLFTPPPPPQPIVEDKPQPQPKPVVQRPPDPPPPPPYERWFVAFLREGSNGQQITIRRTDSGQSQVLAVGERFHDMTFTGYDRLDALFELDGTTYRIGIGQNLANRDNPGAVQ
jgi:hypothetical protein